MELDRRNLMRTTAVAPIAFGVTGMAGGALFTCSPTGIQIDPNVIDAIMQAVATGCNFIPSVTSVIALVGVSFPALVGAATIADSVLAEVSALFCANVPTPAVTPPAAGGAKYTAKTVSGVAVHGWVLENGHLVYV